MDRDRYLTDNSDSKTMAELSPEEFRLLKSKIRREKRIRENTERAAIQPFSDIQPMPVEWLWPERIAIGKLTIFAGDPGLGKSQGALYLAARLSLGKPFPDDTACQQGDTLILTNEDDPGDTIRPRLDALGADVSRIHFLKSRIARDNNTAITLWDIETFRDAVDQIREMGRDFRLLVIDPLEGFLGGTDANKNSNVRETMAGIVGLAGEERFSVIAIQHLNKSGNSAAYRVGGSIAFTALARSVWIFVKDRRNPDRRLFLPLKNNLGIDTGGFAYHTEPVEKSSRIVWDGEVDDDIDDVMSVFPIPPERTSPEQEGILELLRGKAPELMGTGDIAVTLGKRESAVTNLLNKLKKNGLVNNPSYGRWSVSPLSPVSSNSPVSSKGEGGETSAAREVSLPPFTGESSESDEFDETSTGNSLARDKAVQNF